MARLFTSAVARRQRAGNISLIGTLADYKRQAPGCDMFVHVSDLNEAEIAFVRDRLDGDPFHSLYFEAALDAGKGANRYIVADRESGGIVLRVDFDEIVICNTIGYLSDRAIQAMLRIPERTELQMDPGHFEIVREPAVKRLQDSFILCHYRLDVADRADTPDQRSQDIHTLGPNDLDEVHDLFRGREDTVLSAWMLEQPFLGLFEGDELVATAGAIAVHKGIGVANIGNFFTHPAHRGKGAARRLAEALVDDLTLAGIKTVTLGCLESNAPARRVYESVGFRLVDRRHQVDLRALPERDRH